MKSENKKTFLALLLAVIHNVLFWNEIIALNMLVFTALFCTILLRLYPESLQYSNVKWLLLCTGITCLFVIVHNSDLSKIVHIFSLVVLVGFVHQQKLRSIYMAIITTLASLVFMPSLVGGSFAAVISQNEKFACLIKKGKLIIIPLIALYVFYWIYKFANPRFDELTEIFWKVVGDYLAIFFVNFSFLQILLFLAMFSLIAAAFYNPLYDYFLKTEKAFHDFLLLPEKRVANDLSANTHSLKNEYTTALLLVVMVNLLLIIVNIIDVQWIWFDFDPATVQNLSQFVHEGTYLLIVSILLSMGIMLYFFRAGINFYPGNELLKKLCYVWILQNAILAVSVGIRNYHYISSFNLTYKRIGVVVFLILTIVGLVTLWIKVKEKRTSYYLIRINSWAIYIVLILISCVEWDTLIVNYNLNYGNIHHKDTELLMTFSDKTLPLMLKHKSTHFYTQQLEDCLSERIEVFQNRYNETSWLSWNWAEYKAYEQLENVK